MIHWRQIAGIVTCFYLVYTSVAWQEYLAADVFLRVSLTPVVSFAPVDLKGSVSIKDGRWVRAECDCTNGFYSSSTWEHDDRPHQLVFKITSGAVCTFSVEVRNEMQKIIGFRTVSVTVTGRES